MEPTSKLGAGLVLQDLLHQCHCVICTAEGSLVAEATMTVVVNNGHAVDIVLFNTGAAFSQGPQADAMTDNIQPFDPLSLLDKVRADFNATLHDAVGEIHIRECIPVVLLVRTTKDGAAT